VVYHFSEPITGPPGGGTVVTIYGQGFDQLQRTAAPVHVRVGDNLAHDVTVVDDRTITLTTPPGTGGDQEITLIPPIVVTLLPASSTYILAKTPVVLATRFSFGGEQKKRPNISSVLLS
jgi:hypothetical protein